MVQIERLGLALCVLFYSQKELTFTLIFQTDHEAHYTYTLFMVLSHASATLVNELE